MYSRYLCKPKLCFKKMSSNSFKNIMLTLGSLLRTVRCALFSNSFIYTWTENSLCKTSWCWLFPPLGSTVCLQTVTHWIYHHLSQLLGLRHPLPINMTQSFYTSNSENCLYSKLTIGGQKTDT